MAVRRGSLDYGKLNNWNGGRGCIFVILMAMCSNS